MTCQIDIFLTLCQLPDNQRLDIRVNDRQNRQKGHGLMRLPAAASSLKIISKFIPGMPMDPIHSMDCIGF